MIRRDGPGAPRSDGWENSGTHRVAIGCPFCAKRGEAHELGSWSVNWRAAAQPHDEGDTFVTLVQQSGPDVWQGQTWTGECLRLPAGAEGDRKRRRFPMKLADLEKELVAAFLSGRSRVVLR